MQVTGTHALNENRGRQLVFVDMMSDTEGGAGTARARPFTPEQLVLITELVQTGVAAGRASAPVAETGSAPVPGAGTTPRPTPSKWGDPPPPFVKIKGE